MGALSNLKILDFSTLLPGPFATMQLADLGADVIRIESPDRPDLCRMIPPFSGSVSTSHAMLNRNKRAIALDLKNDRAIVLIEKLLSEYDIVIEQFRPGVMDRLNLGYERLKAINPRLIYCSITGYGQTGPYRHRAGHDNNYLSVAGINGYSGRKGERPPVMGTQIADIAGGSLHAVIGILAAVNQRHQTGEGQYVDISMTDAAFSLNALFGSHYLGAGKSLAPESTLLNGGSFYDYYETLDGRYMSVGSLEPHFFQRLCKTLGRDDLLPLGTQQGEKAIERLKSELASVFRTKTLADWARIFAEQDACVEPVLSFSEATEHAQIQARGMVVEVPVGDSANTQHQIAHPIKMSDSKPQYRFSGVPLGEHNVEVLQSLGYSKKEQQELLASGAFGNTGE
jgi:crotonobetainyl-CoA:carnitine CoA-transferase CaiB-like acyl-CoA transferase